ncbi:MAG: hypothetical protein WA885_21600 [Phormidesmis sp.]
MNLSFKKIGVAVSIASGALLSAQVTSAQQMNMQMNIGEVLGAEIMGDRCTITLVDEADQFLTQSADAALCEQILVGNRIQFVSEITQLNVLQPPEVANITRLEAGDRACYVDLTDADNNKLTQFANFEICQQDLVGARVRLTYETGNILAFSCQGDLDCGRSDRVNLISKVDVIERPPAVKQPPISSLPDGNYRYWDGPPTNGIVSNEQFLADGKVAFTFRKQGNNITGIFADIGLDAICVQGQVNENTVTGISIRTSPGAPPLSEGETFRNFGRSDRLKVRRGRLLPSNAILYNSTLLNLEGLNRINAGTMLPPQRCP